MSAPPVVAVFPDLAWLRHELRWTIWLRDGWLYEQERREAEGMTAWGAFYADLVDQENRKIAEWERQIVGKRAHIGDRNDPA
jgi:hypothetical protein